MTHETKGDGEYMKGGTKTYKGGNNYTSISKGIKYLSIGYVI